MHNGPIHVGKRKRLNHDFICFRFSFSKGWEFQYEHWRHLLTNYLCRIWLSACQKLIWRKSCKDSCWTIVFAASPWKVIIFCSYKRYLVILLIRRFFNLYEISNVWIDRVPMQKVISVNYCSITQVMSLVEVALKAHCARHVVS